MAKPPKDELDEDDVEDSPEAEHRRDRDLSDRKKIRDAALKIFKDVDKGYRSQWERANENVDNWEVYNCKLNANQFYNGESKIYVPIVKNAVDARKIRFTNQIFPIGGRYVQVETSVGAAPDALAALAEHYVRKAKLRTEVMPALMKNGDIEGQYNVYISWNKTKSYVSQRVQTKPNIPDTDIPNEAAEEVEDIEESVIEAAHPVWEVIPDVDILVIPNTSESVEDALERGGSATIMRRWTKAKMEEMIREGWIDRAKGEDLIEEYESSQKAPPGQIDQEGKHVDSAGIKGEGDKKHFQVYETWMKLKVKGKLRICRGFYAGQGEQEDRILGVHLNPLWCDRVPLLSVPIEKVSGSFKGISKIRSVAPLQYAANDAINLAWDSAGYSLMPITMTDPEKNPRIGSMILTMGAIWETSPNDTEVVSFPQLWQHGFEMVNNCKNEVSQSLNVSPAAITQGVNPQTKGKQNQAMVAQEQMIDILTTSDAVTIIEEGILTPGLALMMEMDHQFRDEDTTVRAFGEMGLRANMETVPPLQMDRHYHFKWLGVEAARNAQQVQQQISMANVLMQFPKETMQGHEINLVPVARQMVESAFGPRIAPLVFTKPKDQMPVDPEEEETFLSEGFDVPVHKLDPDDMHIQRHLRGLQEAAKSGRTKYNKNRQAHIWLHQQQKLQKQQAAMQQAQAQQQGQQRPPGGAPKRQQGHGGGGSPRPGGMATPPRGGQQPAGAIGQDQMARAGAPVMPRKMPGTPGAL